MSRRKALAKREPSGKVQRHRLGHDPAIIPATEIRRLMDAATSGMRDPMWGTQLGRLCLTHKITSVQFSAGKRWTELRSEYSEACGAPRCPGSPKLDRGARSLPLDPDSTLGKKEVARHERLLRDYHEGCRILVLSGMDSVRAVAGVCELDLAPVGSSDLEALRKGLQSLAAMWAMVGAKAR